MDPKLAEQLARGVADSGNNYVIYVLALFCISVVIYLIRDHVTNNAKLILLVEANTRQTAENNRLMKRLCRHLRRHKRAQNPEPFKGVILKPVDKPETNHAGR